MAEANKTRNRRSSGSAVRGVRESRIQARAYSIWETEGRPEGRELEHWLRAEAEVSPPKPSPKTASRTRRR